MNKNATIYEEVPVLSSSLSEIGYISRTSTQGKEYLLVQDFISFMNDKYKKYRNKKAMIFIEPQLETGFPDIVIAEYYSLPPNCWNDARGDLNTTDLKILCFIQNNAELTIEKISRTLGFPKDITEESVQRLKKAKMIHLYKNGKVLKVPLETYCRIKKIISIEAKINKWSEAIRQANNNTWFSTESYVLLNKDSYSKKVSDTCEQYGLGIILLNGALKKAKESVYRSFPVSFASLQFNEWLIRYYHKEKLL